MKLSEIAGGPERGKILCNIADIDDGRAIEFAFSAGDERTEIFIQRRGNQVFAYENSCPHAHIPLNMKQGIFTEKTGKYFMCQNHGALFDIKSGACLGGPCQGRSLTKVDIDLKEGKIIVC